LNIPSLEPEVIRPSKCPERSCLVVFSLFRSMFERNNVMNIVFAHKLHGFFDLDTQALHPKDRSCPDNKFERRAVERRAVERRAIREPADGEARAG